MDKGPVEAVEGEELYDEVISNPEIVGHPTAYPNLEVNTLNLPSSAGAVRILNIATSNHSTPVFTVHNQPDAVKQPRLWQVITITYGVLPKWIDELRTEYWVAISGSTQPFTEEVLSSQHTYLNIRKGVHQSRVFLHPDTFKRFGPAGKIGVSISIDDREVVFVSSDGGSDRSWLRATHSSPILSKRQTPFWFVEDNYFELENPLSR